MSNTGTEMMPFHNIFNEWYAAQTSKKIRAVWKSKAEKGERISTLVPYGYMKSPDNTKQWIIDEAVADNVRYIFRLCLVGLGPVKIASRLEREEILNPIAYALSMGRSTNHKSVANPYRWEQKTIDIHNPEIIDGHKKVKADISFTAVRLISIPDENELLPLMDEIRNEKSA